jgi:hypothetical protein
VLLYNEGADFIFTVQRIRLMSSHTIAARAAIVLALVSTIAFPIFLHAQPVCNIVDRCDFCVASQGISPLEMGRSGVRFDIRYLALDKMYRSGERIASEESESHLTNQLTLTYFMDEALSASLVLPYVSRSSVESLAGETPEGLQNRGLGDVIALARYKLYSDTRGGRTRVVAATGGLKVPTGTTNKLMADGELADAHMQLGSGTWDPVLGTSAIFAEGDFAIAANALTTIPMSANAAGHRFGNNLNYDATLRYRAAWLNEAEESGLFATIGVLGEWRGEETEAGEVNANSGGNVMYLAPGVQALLSDYTSIEASFELPILHDLNGTQLGETYRLAAGIQYTF